MRYDAILFDFDGTIADTMPGIHQALQYAAEQMGCAPVDGALARRFIGPPILDSAQRYLGLTEEQAVRFYELFREVYNGEMLFNTRVYTGVPQLLRQLRAQGAFVAVASAKPQALVTRLLERFGLSRFFDRVVGKTTIDANTSKEIMIRQALPARYTRAAMVGDRLYDMESAKALGIDAIGAVFSCLSRGWTAAARLRILTPSPSISAAWAMKWCIRASPAARLSARISAR